MQRSTRSRGASHQSTTPTPHCDYGFFSDARPLKSIIVRSDAEVRSRRAILLVIGGVGDQMETRCVTQKDACNTSTCQAGEASRSRGSRNEWQQRSKQQANKTRRRRGLKVMNYFMVQFRNAEFLWRFHCGFCTFCIRFASRSTLYIIMSPGADPDLDVNSEFRRNSYGFSVR